MLIIVMYLHHAQGPAMVSLFKKMQWKLVCYIGSNEVVGRSLSSWLDSASLDGGYRLRSSLFTASSNSTIARASAKASFEVLLSAGCRIFVLYAISVYTGSALVSAKEMGLLDNPKVQSSLSTPLLIIV
jgi:hypothetical protein